MINAENTWRYVGCLYCCAYEHDRAYEHDPIVGGLIDAVPTTTFKLCSK